MFDYNLASVRFIFDGACSHIDISALLSFLVVVPVLAILDHSLKICSMTLFVRASFQILNLEFS